MRLEVGKEAEFIGHRLSDIIYIAEHTAPVDKSDWEGYARSMCKLIARQAREAQNALSVISGPTTND
jgi:hypothetical protein